MSQICQVTGKRPSMGHTVSHANKKVKRRFNINLHSKRFWLEDEKRFIRLKVSTKGIKLIDKIGIKNVLTKLNKHKSDIV